MSETPDEQPSMAQRAGQAANTTKNVVKAGQTAVKGVQAIGGAISALSAAAPVLGPIVIGIVGIMIVVGLGYALIKNTAIGSLLGLFGGDNGNCSVEPAGLFATAEQGAHTGNLSINNSLAIDYQRYMSLENGMNPIFSRPDWIVLHYTGGGTPASNKTHFTGSMDDNDPENNLYVQYIIGRDGVIYQLLPETKKVAGAHGFNVTITGGISISIENIGTFTDGRCSASNGNPFDGNQGGSCYTSEQVTANVNLVKYLMTKWGIPKSHVIGHQDVKTVAPVAAHDADEKPDPGNQFKAAVLSQLPDSLGGGTVTAPAQDCVSHEPIPKDRQEFIDRVKDRIIATDREYQVPASVSLAQTIQETGFGTADLAIKYNNIFGIKGRGPAGSIRTSSGTYRVYHDWSESIIDHAVVLHNGYYDAAFNAPEDSDAFARAIGRVYAEDPGYTRALLAHMRKYNLYQYDYHP